MEMNKAYDYIIVGAGSAGCTLANRLTEDKDVRVLVLEAGGKDTDPWIHLPMGWGKLLAERRNDWMYFTEPEPYLNNRSIECARGKVLGGSSSINAMAYVRGHRGDYDRWRQHGCTGWSYADVLPYFRRQENWEKGEGPYRGGNGPLSVRYTSFVDPLVDGYIAAGKDAGFGFTPDYNGAQQEGFCRLQHTIRNGRRCSAAVAYLRPAMARANLTVEINALVTRIVIEGKKATGIEYVQGGSKITVRADREVILAGGVINSPQILMLSGIGPAARVKALGIALVQDVPGVGENLQDHISSVVEFRRRDPGPFHAQMRLDQLAINLSRGFLMGQGPATDLPSGFMAFIKSRPGLEIPDIQFLFRAVAANAHPWFPLVKPAYVDTYALRAVLLRPESKGRVEVVSADPRAPVKIKQNFLQSQNDVRFLREGFKITREISYQQALAPFRGDETLPGKDVKSDADLDEHIRRTSWTAHHPCGTCKMGIDDQAVVDPELKVRGIDRLRVVDAAVFPDLVGGNINAPVIMIAERASDLIRGRKPLAQTAA